MNTKLCTDELGRISAEEYRNTAKVPLVIVLDNVRSMNNVGAVFRTADAFLVKEIHLCGYTPVPPHREIQKTALGATETVCWHHDESVLACVQNLKKQAYSIVAIEQAEKTILLSDYQPKGKIAVVFGNEVNGVSQEVIDIADAVVEIPQFGTKHSLNISVCAGIVTWDFYNKLQ